MATNKALYNLIVKKAVARGARKLIAELMATQAMYESTHGTSSLAKNCNNYSGIIYVNQPGATKCSNKQATNDGGRHYAKYKDINAWLTDFTRILKKAPGKPYSDAKSLSDYVTRLKMNKYFSDSTSNYKSNLKSVWDKYHAPLPPIYGKKPPRNILTNPGTKSEQRREADERVRTGQDKEDKWQAADEKKFSLQQWFERQSSLNKAILIGVTGLAIKRLFD